MSQKPRVGRYEIRALLGAGGMGEVYLAYDPGLHRQVALKVLRADLTADEVRLERFEREAHAASSLNHPNILTIHEIGSDKKDHFIVTEYVDGESLAQHLRRGSFQIHEVLEIGIQAASALAAAHAAGIMHRDIKPDNIMLRRDHLVKILDFGLAKLSDTGPTAQPGAEKEVTTKQLSLTTPGFVMGTPPYMSPEQARGLAMDARTDIWSLGAVLYEMVTGCAPFTGQTASDVLVDVLTKHPAPPTTYRADVPAELERIINKALRKDVNERYQMVNELELDLKTLKHQLEFQAELDRSGEGRRSGAVNRIVTSPEDSRLTQTLVAERLQDSAVSHRHSSSGAASGSHIEAGLPEGDAHFHEKVFRRRRWIWLAAGISVLMALGVMGWLYFRAQRQALRLTEKDIIVLADFANTTGDAVFDDTLTTALKVSLRQSPFLNVLSDSDVARTLKMMTRPAGTKLTPEVAQELGQRAGARAYLAGSIASLGSEYVMGLRVVNCLSGDTLAQEQVTAASKEKVLDALGNAASRLRGELGESLATVQRFDVPLAQATTPSLEALQAYSLARKTMIGEGGDAAAVPLYQRAIRLDPNFAMAYVSLGTSYFNLSETNLATMHIRKAYELREQVSEREKINIEARYYRSVIGDVEKARQVYELWAQTYPRDYVPVATLGSCQVILGQHDKALANSREALRLNTSGLHYAVLVNNYVHLDQLKEAQATAEEALAKNFESPYLHVQFYEIAFLKNDAAGMAQQVGWAAGKRGVEDELLGFEADTAAYYGRLRDAREFSRRAAASAERAEKKEAAASYESRAALREALFGKPAEARQLVTAALALSNGRRVQGGAAVALAMAGDSARAQALADDLASRFPEDTAVRFNLLPSIDAQLALNRNDASKAIELLQAATPYELGNMDPTPFYPVYFRGRAYLAARRGREAGAEFQKILDHRGLLGNSPIAALAHLQIGRAYAMQGEIDRAKAGYQDFFALWKDADADVPLLKVARTEYEKLK